MKLMLLGVLEKKPRRCERKLNSSTLKSSQNFHSSEHIHCYMVAYFLVFKKILALKLNVSVMFHI